MLLSICVTATQSLVCSLCEPFEDEQWKRNFFLLFIYHEKWVFGNNFSLSFVCFPHCSFSSICCRRVDLISRYVKKTASPKMAFSSPALKGNKFPSLSCPLFSVVNGGKKIPPRRFVWKFRRVLRVCPPYTRRTEIRTFFPQLNPLLFQRKVLPTQVQSRWSCYMYVHYSTLFLWLSHYYKHSTGVDISSCIITIPRNTWLD